MKLSLRYCFPLLCISGFATVQAQAPKITYVTPAVPIERALIEISKQAGMPLRVSPQVADEIIILSFKGVDLETVKAQIAKACSAKWELVQGGEMLIPDLVLRRQEEQKERSEYAATISKSLTELAATLNPPKPDPKNKENPPQIAMEGGMFFGGGASGRAVIKLALAIGAQNLAAIDGKSRIVFSTNPTRMQRPMPGAFNAILGTLVSEYNIEFAKRQKNKSEEVEPENEQMKRFREMFGDFDGEPKQIEGTPTKAILVCSRQQMIGGLNLTLKVFNDKGKVIISGMQMINTGDNFMSDAMDFEMGPDGLPREKPTPKKSSAEKPIEFSKTTTELSTLSNVMQMGTNTSKMSEELRMKLLNPEQYDPLSFYHSEALLATASVRGKSLVAVLPDRMESFLSMMMSKDSSMTPTAYLESIADEATVSADGSVILVRPSKPAKSRKDRMHRPALGLFLRNTDARGSVSLDDLAKYAQNSESPMEDSGAMVYFMMFAPNAIQAGMGGQVSWDALRFYGALSTLQKKNMSEGGRLGFNQLNPIQAAAVRQLAYGPEENLITEDPNAKKPDFELPSFMRGFMGRFGGDYRSEPTEVMPNGLPSDGYVVLSLTQDKIAKPTGNVPAMFGNAVLGADELALFKMFKDMPGMEQMTAMMPVIDEVKLGERSVYEFVFNVAPGVTMQKTLNDDRISSKSPTVKMANLPADFAKKIDERLAAFKKLPFFDPAFMQPNRGGVPPPTH